MWHLKKQDSVTEPAEVTVLPSRFDRLSDRDKGSATGTKAR